MPNFAFKWTNLQTEPGWIAVLPIEGSYTIHLRNLVDRSLGCLVLVDGERTGPLIPLPAKGCRSIKYELVDTSSLFTSAASPARRGQREAGEATLPDRFGTIKVLVREIIGSELRQEPIVKNEQKSEKKFKTQKKDNQTFLARSRRIESRSPRAPGETYSVIICSPNIEEEIFISYRGKAWASVMGFLPIRIPLQPQQQHQVAGVRNNIEKGLQSDGESVEDCAAPATKRRKVEAYDPDRQLAAMSGISFASTTREFLAAVAQYTERSVEEYGRILAHLDQMKIHRVEQLKELTRTQLVEAYLPRALTETQRRHISAQLQELLQCVKPPVVLISLLD